MSKTTEKITELARPVVERNGCELWDVEYVREAGAWFLRVYIDKQGGVSINDCEAISRELDPILDEEDPIADSYTFEVSSAGAERALKRPSDFEHFMGSYCSVKLYTPKNGSKEHLGYLCGYDGGAVTISVGESEEHFDKSEVASVHLRIE